MQHAEIVVGPDIPVDDKESLVTQQRQRTENSATGFQGFAFGGVANADTVARSIAEIVFDLLAEPGMIDHNLGKPGSGQRSQVVLDQRHATCANHRLGRGQGQGTHALALARRQNHCLHAGTPARRLASRTSSSASSGRRAITASI
ncbi:hypothetical protein D3C80_1457790 [compost metagenome]